MGVQIPQHEGAIFREGTAHCAKTAELIEMLSGMWTRVGPRKRVGY